jgi:hypothetical protein
MERKDFTPALMSFLLLAGIAAFIYFSGHWRFQAENNYWQ